MHGKIMFAFGAAVGYVVGSRSGREAYDRLKERATEFWQDPRVKEKVSEAQEFAKEKLPVAGEKISQAAKKVTDRQKHDSASPSSGEQDSQAQGTSGASGATMGTPSPTAGVTPNETEPSLASPYGESPNSNEGTQGNA